MVSIGLIRAAQIRYYTGLANQHYFSEGGESPGEWLDNRAAWKFGLYGRIDNRQLENLAYGYDPDGRKALAQRAGDDDRRGAYDFCFSCPKYVSAMWAIATDVERRRIEEAFSRAVDRALNFVNDYAGETRLGKGGYEHEKVDLLMGKFIHRSSRAQEPQLHCHALILNVAQRADGTFGTLEGGNLLHIKKAIGAYFRSAFSEELAIPVERDPKKRWSFRVKGVAESLVDSWSTRSKEIIAEVKAHGVDGAIAKALAALSTRHVKGHRALAELLPSWRKDALEHGFTEKDVSRILAERRPELSQKEATKLVDRAIENSIKELTASNATFTRNDLIRDVCIATVEQGISPNLITDRISETLTREQFINLGTKRYQERLTTREIYHEIEGRGIAAAERLSERTTRTVGTNTLSEVIDRSPKPLNLGQTTAAVTVVNGPDLTLVEGAPGSGKSTMFLAVSSAIKVNGGNVIGLCPSNRAARELESNTGIKSSTIDRFIYDQERLSKGADVKHHLKMIRNEALKQFVFKPLRWNLSKLPLDLQVLKRPKTRCVADERTTIIVDECSMAENWKLSKALVLAERAGSRIILVGDRHQLPAIGQGGLFAHLYDTAKPEQKAELTEIVRQNERWVKDAIGNIRDGKIREALQAYKERGFIDSEAKTRPEAMTKLIETWKERGVENPKDNLIIAQTNAEVDSLNAQAQEARRAAGRLGWKYLTVGDEKFHAGDRIIFTDQDKKLGVCKSEFATVIDIDVQRRKMTVQRDNVEKPITFSIDKFDGIRLGMAVTTHRSQSMTIDQDVYILAGGSMQSLEMSVVQFSRARNNSRIFIDKESAGPELTNLEQQMTRSAEKTSAHAIARENKLELYLHHTL